MKTVSNFLVVAAGVAVIVLGYLVDRIEETLDGSILGCVFDGVMIAAMFFGVMQILKWAVWLLG